MLLFLFRSRWGLRVRATTQNRVMGGAVGINTTKVDRVTFALGCGIAGMAGAAFTTIASTGPTTGSLYIVDTFYGGGVRRRGEFVRHHRLGVQHRPGAIDSGVLHDQLDGEGSDPADVIVTILMLRPEGLFAAKVRR
ncbi:MAG: hypothetical protein MPW16_15835 [Candidatus Manganitrophus sp.]|nr:MAG: hypothetical protein MPW16_15835 [Candidatus Manganitrophus sp.]